MTTDINPLKCSKCNHTMTLQSLHYNGPLEQIEIWKCSKCDRCEVAITVFPVEKGEQDEN